MLTILFLLLHLARNLTWIRERVISSRNRNEQADVKKISFQPHDIKTMLNKKQAANDPDRASGAGLQEVISTLISKLNAGIIDESGFREEMSRLLIAAEPSAVKKTA